MIDLAMQILSVYAPNLCFTVQEVATPVPQWIQSKNDIASLHT